LSEQPINSPEQNGDIVPLSLNPDSSSQPLPRPIPPPLPPRSNISSVVERSPETSQPTVERAQLASPASEALKSIATKDENKRNESRDETESATTLSKNSTHDDISKKPSAVSETKPPLPPRRMSTSA
jgi:hypothetical protein